MIRTILIVLLAIGVVGVGYWGYSEHQEKRCCTASSGEYVSTSIS